MLKAAIEGSSENKIGRNKTIVQIESMINAAAPSETCSIEDKELLLNGVQLLALLNNEDDEQTRTNASKRLLKLSLEYQNYSLINSIIVQLKFNRNPSFDVSDLINDPYIIEDSLIDHHKLHMMHHIKIWFPRKDTHPLGGVVNELRLIRQSKLYLERREQLTLLTNFNTKDDENYVQSFCEKHGICYVTPSDIQRELENQEWEDKSVQLKLFDIAMAELTHPAGHPVIASDLFRLLSPVLKLGGYSDTDQIVQYDMQKKSTVNSLSNLILNLKFQLDLPRVNNITINTDFIWTRNTEHPILIKHRKNIYLNYYDFNFIYNLNMSIKVTLFGEPLNIDQIYIDKFKQFCQEYFPEFPDNFPENILKFRGKLRKYLPLQFETYFYYYTMYLAGPYSLNDTLFSGKISQEFIDEAAKCRISESPIKLVSENFNKRSDLSWLDIGVNKRMNEEKKMIESARIIQRFWRNTKTTSKTDNNSEQTPSCNI